MGKWTWLDISFSYQIQMELYYLAKFFSAK